MSDFFFFISMLNLICLFFIPAAMMRRDLVYLEKKNRLSYISISVSILHNFILNAIFFYWIQNEHFFLISSAQLLNVHENWNLIGKQWFIEENFSFFSEIKGFYGAIWLLKKKNRSIV